MVFSKFGITPRGKISQKLHLFCPEFRENPIYITYGSNLETVFIHLSSQLQPVQFKLVSEFFQFNNDMRQTICKPYVRVPNIIKMLHDKLTMYTLLTVVCYIVYVVLDCIIAYAVFNEGLMDSCSADFAHDNSLLDNNQIKALIYVVNDVMKVDNANVLFDKCCQKMQN